MKIQDVIIEGLRDPKDNPCWKGYHPVGTKKKAGRTVPNCVPNEGVEETSDYARRRDREEKIISGQKPARKRQPAQTSDYALRREQEKKQGVLEASDEYDDEAGMAHTNLITIARAAKDLLKTIDPNENLPEWVQEKIAKVEQMLVGAWDYLKSQEAQGIDPRIMEEYQGLLEDWQKVNKKDRTPGMSKKAVKAYRREHPGSKLQTAVTTKPSKLKKGSKASKRRKSFCARSLGQKKMHNIDCSKDPDKAICAARRRWNCE